MENLLLSFGFVKTAKDEYKNGRYTAVLNDEGCWIVTRTLNTNRLLDISDTYTDIFSLKKRLLNTFD